jgi:hypothetical protein
MPRLIDLTGRKFGRLTVEHLSGRDHGQTVWTCRCVCGNTKQIVSGSLTRGHTRSCGCLLLEHLGSGRARYRHGDAVGGRVTPELTSWMGMNNRCNNPRGQDYKDYGGRGIRICERWKLYENFLADLGRKPSPRHSIDRIDVNGDYEPENCCWATPVQQRRNQRRYLARRHAA